MSSSTSGTEERPYRLEVWEMDPDAAEEAWRQWSAYREASNALDRRDKLRAKDKQARVVDTRTGNEVDNVRCLFCGDHHPEPYDGSCLL